MKIPQTAPDILDIIKKDPEIISMIADPKIQKFITKYNRDYLHWDELRHRELPMEAEKMWVLLKSARMLQAKMFDFGGWTFQYVLTGETLRRLHLLDTKGGGNQR